MSCADAPLTLSLSPSDGERVAFRTGEGSRWTFENQFHFGNFFWQSLSVEHFTPDWHPGAGAAGKIRPIAV